MIKLAILSLLVAIGCVHAGPVAAPVTPTPATAPAKDPPPVAKPVELPNRAIAIVQLANKDVQCADLRRPGDLADSAVCMLPNGAFMWLSATASALEVKQVADAPPAKIPEGPATNITPTSSTKVSPTKAAVKGAPKP